MGSQNYTDITYLVKDLLENASEKAVQPSPIITKNYTDITYLVKKAQKKEKVKGLLETSARLTSLIAIFIAFSLLLNFYLNQENNNRNAIIRSQVLGAAVSAPPAHLIIPQINVSSDIESVGVTTSGAMEVPSDIANVGWFKLGPPPGEKGSAVISGHVDGKNGEAGIFANLYKLKVGDKLYIDNGKGATITFIVRESRIYDPGYADEVFNKIDGAHLNLVTCDGFWDGIKKSYSKRLVIFADLAS